MPRSRLLAFLLCATVLFTGCTALSRSSEEAQSDSSSGLTTDSAGPPSFSLEVKAPDNVRMVLEKHLELQRFRLLPDLQANELQRLLGATDANARDLLGTLGYFAPHIQVQLLETPHNATTPRNVVVSVDPGPQTFVIQADIGFAQASDEDAQGRDRQLQRIQRDWSLSQGQAFTQSAWDAAKNSGLRQLQVRRYPTARIASSRAEIDADVHQAQLKVLYEPGPLYRFGRLRLEGSERYDPDAARRIARLPTGAVYDEASMLDAQLRLASSGYYDAVFLTLDTENTSPLSAPVVAKVREAPLQKVVFGAGVSTDSGPQLSIDHIHNKMPILGWRAVSKLSLDNKKQLLGSEWTDLPDENGWRGFTSGELQRETTGDYDVNSARIRGGRSKSTQKIDRNYFLQYDYAKSEGINAPSSGSAISLNYGWTGRYFNNMTSPTRGQGLALEMGLGMTLTPDRDPFVRALVRWQTFLPAGRVLAADGTGRNARISLRTEAGAVVAKESAQIPVTQLFLTGGDTTVRGYGYRKIGARTHNDQLYGGRYMAVTSLEWQRPIVYKGAMTDWESALFVDAGAVADRTGDLDPRVGIGAGLRWSSPVGPLQADLAYGVQAKDIRLHLRLGFSF